MQRRPLSTEAALARLEEICSRSERCTHEVLVKLHTWGINRHDASDIIDRLTDSRYIDDSRYAHAFVRDKHLFSRWGRRKIRAALVAKRISSAEIDEAIDEEIDEDTYIANLSALLLAKTRNMPRPLDFESRRKIAAFGVSRGYEPATVIGLMRTLSFDADDTTSMD